MRAYLVLAAIAALLMACDPGDPQWDGRAPYAPEVKCDHETCPDKYGEKGYSVETSVVDEEAFEKHSGTHVASLQVVNGFAGNLDWCSGTPSTAGLCMKTRWKWYEASWVDPNSGNQFRRVHHIAWSYGWQYMPGWQSYVDADVLICFGGVCDNVANSQSSTSDNGTTSMRYGSTYAHNGMSYGQNGLIEAAIRPKSGVTLPAKYAQLDVTLFYLD